MINPLLTDDSSTVDRWLKCVIQLYVTFCVKTAVIYGSAWLNKMQVEFERKYFFGKILTNLNSAKNENSFFFMFLVAKYKLSKNSNIYIFGTTLQQQICRKADSALLKNLSDDAIAKLFVTKISTIPSTGLNVTSHWTLQYRVISHIQRNPKCFYQCGCYEADLWLCGGLAAIAWQAACSLAHAVK